MRFAPIPSPAARVASAQRVYPLSPAATRAKREPPGSIQEGGVRAPATGHAGAELAAFIAGPENELVASVVTHLVGQLSRTASARADTPDLPSPLLLIGPPGSGKSHLAQGLAALWATHRGADTVAFYTAADFARGFAEAIGRQDVRRWRRSLRQRQLVVIDDAHRLGNSDHKATELRQTLDALHDHGGFALLTFSEPPTKAAAFDRPLLGRLAAGITLSIAPPGVAARRELLLAAAAASGRPIDNATAAALAKRLPADTPRVLGAAARLRNPGPSRDRPPARAAAEDIVADARRGRAPALQEILRVTARYHHVPLRVLTSASRKQGIVTARAVAIYLARRLTRHSYAQIGQALGGRDHTTIMHNHRRVARELPKDRALQSAVGDLERLLT